MSPRPQARRKKRIRMKRSYAGRERSKKRTLLSSSRRNTIAVRPLFLRTHLIMRSRSGTSNPLDSSHMVRSAVRALLNTFGSPQSSFKWCPYGMPCIFPRTGHCVMRKARFFQGRSIPMKNRLKRYWTNFFGGLKCSRKPAWEENRVWYYSHYKNNENSYYGCETSNNLHDPYMPLLSCGEGFFHGEQREVYRLQCRNGS